MQESMAKILQGNHADTLFCPQTHLSLLKFHLAFTAEPKIWRICNLKVISEKDILWTLKETTLSSSVNYQSSKIPRDGSLDPCLIVKKLQIILKPEGEHYAEWNKPVRERQIPHDFTHMWNLINKLRTNKQNRDRFIDREQDNSYGKGEVRGWRDWAKKRKDSWTWTTVWWLGGANKGTKW